MSHEFAVETEIFVPIHRPKLVVPRVADVPRSLLGIGREAFKRVADALQNEAPPLADTLLLMAGSKSNYLSKKQIEEVAGGVAFSAPGTVFYALWTSALSDTSTGSTAGEGSYASYARVNVTNDQTTGFNASTGTTTATVTNKNAVNWPANTGSSQTMTFLGILDASSAGNMLFWTDVTSVTINGGDTPQLAAAALSLVDD